MFLILKQIFVSKKQYFNERIIYVEGNYVVYLIK